MSLDAAETVARRNSLLSAPSSGSIICSPQTVNEHRTCIEVMVKVVASLPPPPSFPLASHGVCMCVCGQLVPLVFSIAKKLGCTNKGGVLAACFVIFDMLNTTESRLVLMDAQVGGESE